MCSASRVGTFWNILAVLERNFVLLSRLNSARPRGGVKLTNKNFFLLTLPHRTIIIIIIIVIIIIILIIIINLIILIISGFIGRFLCTMTGVLPVLFSFVSSFTIICISLDR